MLRGLPLVVLVLVSSTLSRAAELEWLGSVDEAREKAAEKPVVLYFKSAECGWCRKMEAGTFRDAGVLDTAKAFTWVRVDIEEEKELAARYRIRGVPAIVVLDSRGRTLAGRGGYQTAREFARFLDRALTDPEPPDTADAGEQLLEEWTALKPDESPSAELLSKTVVRLARTDRALRKELTKAIVARGEVLQPKLLDLMSSDRLAVRAAAYEVLKQASKARHPFDPFADAETREEQLRAWMAASE